MGTMKKAVTVCLALLVLTRLSFAGVDASHERVGGPWLDGGNQWKQQIRITIVVTADVPTSALIEGKYWVNTEVEGLFGPFAVSSMQKQGDGTRVHSFIVSVPKDATVAVHAQRK